MYLAPLNYDRYFQKVFSDLEIAKRFLEDFLDIQIQEIEFLPAKNKITDDAQTVEFDFRCKIDDSYVIIEMQQWYKPNVVQRFYVYHALGAALQLEKMPKKLVPLQNGKTRKVQDYSELLPTITIIWMVHDKLDFKEDFISYVLTPEYIISFLKDTEQWNIDNYELLLEKRNHLLTLLENSKGNINFLQKNKLIYAFQKNIVANKNFKKYYDWFELAEKTLKFLADKFEYSKYLGDEILTKVVNRLKISLAESDSEEYITDYGDYLEGVRRHNRGIEKEYKEEIKAVRKLKEEALAKEKKERKLKEEALAKEKEALAKVYESVRQMKKFKMPIEAIVQATGLSIDEINNL